MAEVQHLKLTELVKASDSLKKQLVVTSGIGRGFVPRKDLNTNVASYQAYLQDPNTQEFIRLSGSSKDSYDVFQIYQSLFNTSSEANIPLDVILQVSHVNPTEAKMMGFKLGPYIHASPEYSVAAGWTENS